jgi:glycosyltransferase involved in cell wall biosynthesis
MRPPVLHIIPFLWSGAGSVVTRLCEAQRQQGPVAIVTGGQPDASGDWDSYRRRLRRAGVTHHTIDFFHRADGVFWSSVSALADVMRDLRPGVIHAHAGVPSCGAVAARAITSQRARIIGQMYSWGPDRPEWMNVQDTWGLGQTDRVVCSARAYWDLLVRYGVPRRKLVYLPWGLPLDLLTPRDDAERAARAATNGHAAGARGPVIGFVGRIEPRKGQLDLVAAFARVRRDHPQARLELIGPVADAAYAREITAAIDRAALADAVTLTGEVRDPSTWVRRWDLFASLSSDEGQGLAVLEAMAMNVPVVARPVAGISDFLVDGRTGFAVARSGAIAAARTLLRAIAQPAQRQRVARGARRLVERRYAWDRTVETFERLYWA